VVALYAQILARLQRDARSCSSRIAGEEHEVAARMLERVKMMRVFDFEGLQEAVEEVRAELEGGGAAGKQGNTLDAAKETSMERKAVADSEDEDGDADEEEMLFTNAIHTLDPTTPPTPKFLLITNIAHVLSPIFKKNHMPGMYSTVSSLDFEPTWTPSPHA